MPKLARAGGCLIARPFTLSLGTSEKLLMHRLGTQRHIHRPNAVRPHGRRPLAVEPLEDRCLLSGDLVLSWNQTLLAAIRQDRTPPPLAARAMAMVHVAVYDALEAIEQKYTPYHVTDVAAPRAPPGRRPWRRRRSACWRRSSRPRRPRSRRSWRMTSRTSATASPGRTASPWGRRSPTRSWRGAAPITSRCTTPRMSPAVGWGNGGPPRTTPSQPCSQSGARPRPSR
jgi:hypothetical protein